MRPGDREPDIILPHAQMDGIKISKSSKFFAIVVAVLFLAFVAIHNAVPLFTDWLWFKEVHATQVFTTELISKTELYLLAFVIFFLVFYGSLKYASGFVPNVVNADLIDRVGEDLATMIQKFLGLLVLGLAIFFSLWAGLFGSQNWADWLLFLHGTRFPGIDPLFHNSIGFYIFQVPFYNQIYDFLLSLFIITLISTFFLYLLAFSSNSSKDTVSSSKARAHILVLVGLIALTQAFGTRMGAYDLLQNANGIFSGPGYADTHFTLPAMDLQIIFLICTGVACFVAIKLKNLKLPAIFGACWLASLVIGGSLLPYAVQQLVVTPNQFSMEKPFIRRNIRYTREAYDLKHVTEVDNFPAGATLTAADLQQNSATLNNVRVWDHSYLGKVYEQLDTIKPYYAFQKMGVDGSISNDISIDRYVMNDGQLREVMLAPREMNVGALPNSAQTWQNKRLIYTHGYGLMMSPVNKTVDGSPFNLIQGFPPQESANATDISVSRPDIYYGTLSEGHVYVDTKQKEFDYPSTSNTANGEDQYNRYHGSGGIVIGSSFLRQLAFAIRLGDWNLLLADNLTSKTRIMYRRDIRNRVRLVAPFLQQDHDPYLVVDPDNGHLVWMLDCYTITDRYPCSTASELAVNPQAYEAPNYIRNSVKATVDAYTGKVSLYISDPSDPIIQTWSKIFPHLMQPISAMPAGLQKHIRYPEDLFLIQRAIYATYHVDDPLVFYQKEDAWAVPTEPSNDPNEPSIPMSPYYVVMKLPDLGEQSSNALSKKPEFVLMSPLSPINKEDQNILGWMCARCDPPHYGQLVLYRFPQQASVLGPSQIVQRINSDRVISPQLSLLRSGGSTASLGNLLVIPVDRSLLYIAPLYVEATTSSGQLPKLVKVIVAYGNQEVMADTLDEALNELFAGYTGPSITTSPGASISTTTTNTKGKAVFNSSVKSQILKADSEYNTAQQQLKAGDFAAYGSTMNALKQTLSSLKNSVGE